MCHDTTKLLLGIADENLKITDGETGEDGVIRLTGYLDYTPKACPKCGIINDQKIINYGWRNTTIRFSKVLSNTVILALKRRYFHCKECHGNFLAQTVAVPKHCTISNTSRKECLEKLGEPVSLKHIANEVSASDSFVGRQLMRAERDFQTNWHYLPEIILMDEVKSTKSATGAMSFEFMNGETHELIDLLPYRTINKLEKYFYRFDQAARENVKIIVTDMNYTYPKLVQTVFPNAMVVMDKFHIITTGAIKVDEHLRTTAPNVWALGDVNGGPQFTYISLDDFRIVKDQLFGSGTRSTADRHFIPTTTFLTPPLATIGLTQAAAQAAGHQVLVFQLKTQAILKARVMEDQRGLYKVIVDQHSHEILGATLYAQEAHEVINLIALAMNGHLKYELLRDMLYTHPTMAEALNDLFQTPLQQ